MRVAGALYRRRRRRRGSRAVRGARLRRGDSWRRESGSLRAEMNENSRKDRIVAESAAQPQRKALNPFVKFALELGPLALFFAVYSRLGIFAATGVLMAGVTVTLGVSYAM